MPLPVEAVRARGVARRHPVFLALDVERMAADPGVPAAVSVLDHGILDADGLVAREDRANVHIGKPFKRLGLEEPYPPVLAVRRRAADVEPPAVVEAEERRPFDHRCAPAFLVECDDGLEAVAVGRACDHVRVGGAVSPAQPVGEHDRAVLVVGGARRAGPVLWAWSRCGDDNRTRAGRQRESAHSAVTVETLCF